MTGANPTSGNPGTDSRGSRARAMLDRGAFCAGEIAARNEVVRWVDAGAFERAHDSALALLEAVRIRRASAEQAGFVEIVGGPCEALLRPGLYLVQPPVVGIDGQRLGESAVASGVAAWVLTREPRTKRDLWPVVGVATQARRAQVPPAFDERRETADSVSAEAWTAWFRDTTRQLGEVFLAQVADVSHPAWRASDLLEATRAAPESLEVIEALIEACAGAGKSGPAPARPRPVSEGEDPHAF